MYNSFMQVESFVRNHKNIVKHNRKPSFLAKGMVEDSAKSNIMTKPHRNLKSLRHRLNNITAPHGKARPFLILGD